MSYSWNLNDLYRPGDFEVLYKEARNRVGEYLGICATLKRRMSLKRFRQVILKGEELKKRVSILYWRAALEEASDMSSEEARMNKGRARDLELEADRALRKLWHWVMGRKTGRSLPLDNINAFRLFGACPEMSDHLKNMREMASHTLSEREEMIIDAKDACGIEPLTDMRALIETGFEYDFRPEGKRGRRVRSQAELMRYVYSPVPENRRAAYTVLLEKYRDNTDKFFSVFRSVVKDWGFETGLRGYDSPIQMRNKLNRVPDGAVEALLDACRKNRHIFKRYFGYKAGEDGQERLPRFDIYSPSGKKEKKVSFEKALDTVLKTFGEFSPGFHKRALKIIEKNHIDTHPSPVKQPGAFCASCAPGVVPYVFLNYTGTSRDLLTLAHELGHAIHGLYAGNLSPSVYHAGLPLAETASTFAELIVFDRMYRDADSAALRKRLLSGKLQESYASILRQAYFVKFEIKAHELLENGVTPEELSDAYFELLEEQFSGSVDIDRLFRYEWAYIPHIVRTPFYCYAYCFGELLSLVLYNRYRENPDTFIPGFERILSAGGSASPVDILGAEGYDITSPGFWEQGFRVLEGYQEDLEKL